MYVCIFSEIKSSIPQLDVSSITESRKAWRKHMEVEFVVQNRNKIKHEIYGFGLFEHVQIVL